MSSLYIINSSAAEEIGAHIHFQICNFCAWLENSSRTKLEMDILIPKRDILVCVIRTATKLWDKNEHFHFPRCCLCVHDLNSYQALKWEQTISYSKVLSLYQTLNEMILDSVPLVVNLEELEHHYLDELDDSNVRAWQHAHLSSRRLDHNRYTRTLPAHLTTPCELGMSKENCSLLLIIFS